MNTLRIPLIKSERAAFFLVFLAGLFLCTRGVGPSITRGWLYPPTILGFAFGILATLLGASVLFRRRIWPITSDRAALVALVGLIATKIVIATIFGL
jgi:hypothetical protein